MTVDVATITAERLKLWAHDCVEAHATPMMLLAVGHDHASGDVHVFVPEDDDIFNAATVKDMLLLIIEKL